jgi:hypothetical protein
MYGNSPAAPAARSVLLPANPPMLQVSIFSILKEFITQTVSCIEFVRRVRLVRPGGFRLQIARPPAREEKIAMNFD